MKIEEAKALLYSNGISYDICCYSNEAEFWKHLSLYSDYKKAKLCKVTVIVIRCKNGHKDVELQFNSTDDGDIFVELFFGDYSYELFDCGEELLPNEIIRNINSVLQCNISIIVAYDLRRKRWLGDICYDKEVNSGETYYKTALERIHKPKSLVAKLFHDKRQYEIYDFENYQCIIK